MKTQESAEMYLETIYVLRNRLGTVRSIDIANELGYSKPSVSIAMKSLKENGCIETDGDGYILLTGKGKSSPCRSTTGIPRYPGC